MNVLVTGGAGYIGSHTCVELLNSGYGVVVIDNLCNSNAESLNRVQKLTGKTLKFYEGDVRDEALLRKIFAENEIGSVIHFAGLKAVGESVAKPLEYYENNLGSTMTLCRVMAKQGIKRIYTACPNCTLQLREIPGFEIVPVWPVLAAYIRPEDITSPHGSYIWHDPCPTRNEPDQQEAARALLKVCGCDCIQPEHTGCKTQCCGNFHMLAAIDPEKSAKMRAKRLKEFPEERTIVSSCEGCLGAFRGESRDTIHLLELLFGKSDSRGWGNRIQNTLK